MNNEKRSAIQDRLEELSLVLPKLGETAYSYLPYTRHDGVLYLSGQISRTGSGEVLTGCVGKTATTEQGIHAAQVAALNLPARIDQAVGLENVTGILKLHVWVSSSADFTEQPVVAEGASELLAAVLGGPGRHARAALPTHVLLKNSLVELDAVVAFHS